MSLGHQFIIQIALVFLASFIGGILAERAKQSPVVGYILGGIVIGPYTTGLVNNVDLIAALSEVGIVLIMFTLGIEFSLKRLAAVKRVAVLGGLLQVSLTALAGTGAALWMGFNSGEALFIGCALSISSTMIVLRSLGEAGESNTLHGHVMMGILVVQDLAVIMMAIVLPRINQLRGDYFTFFKPLILICAFLAVMYFLAVKVVPGMLDRVATRKNNDLFLLLALVMGLGVAMLFEWIGLSLSLGAFLAGLVISESEYAHEIMGKVASLRDALVIIFFVSVGLGINLRLLAGGYTTLVLVLLVLMVLKSLLIFAVVRMFKFHSKVAFYTGIGLMQTGEFSLVLAQIGFNSGIVSNGIYNVILIGTVISMVLTPLLINKAPGWYQNLRRLWPLGPVFKTEDVAWLDTQTELEDHVIVCGYGKMGSSIGAGLSAMQIPFVAIDFDYHALDAARDVVQNFIYGDAANETVLSQARPDKARLAVITMPDVHSSSVAVWNLQKLNPDLVLLARAHSAWHSQVLYEAGVSQVVSPETAAGFAMIRQIILRLRLPEETTRNYLEQMYFADFKGIQQNRGYQMDIKNALRAREFVLPEHSPWNGLSLAQLQLRQRTGCNVVSIRRKDDSLVVNPAGDEPLHGGDTLVVLGNDMDLLTFSRLKEGEAS